MQKYLVEHCQERRREAIDRIKLNQCVSKLDNPPKTPPLIFIHCERCKEIHELKHNCTKNSSREKKG